MERKRELVRHASPKTSIMKSSISYKVLFGHYIPPKTMKITKMTKSVNYFRDKMGRNKKGGQKVKRKKGARVRSFVGCEVSQGLRNSKLFCVFCMLSGSAALISN